MKMLKLMRVLSAIPKRCSTAARELCSPAHFYLIVNMMDEEDMMEDMMEDMVNMTDMMQDMMDMMNMMGLMDRYLMGRVSIGHVASLLSRLGMKLLAKDLGYRFVLKNPLYFSHICNSIICFKDLSHLQSLYFMIMIIYSA